MSIVRVVQVSLSLVLAYGLTSLEILWLWRRVSLL